MHYNVCIKSLNDFFSILIKFIYKNVAIYYWHI